MYLKVKGYSQFFYGSHFYESVKITIGLLTPALILAQFDQLELGVALSLGAMCGNIVDGPGPMAHRRNAMLITSPLLFVFTFVSCVIGVYPYVTIVYIAVCSFVLSMLYVYGVRAASVGVSVLLMVVLSVDDGRSLSEIVWYSLGVFAGSVWYTALSYSFHKIRPYRFAQQSIADYLRDVSDFLRIKANFYEPHKDFGESYGKLILRQAVITEKQDAIRDLLFTTREIVKEGTPEGRFLTQVFRDTVDLFEQLSSTQYDYKDLRRDLGGRGILYKFRDVLHHISLEVDEISYALNLGEIPKMRHDFEFELKDLDEGIALLEKEQGVYGFGDEVIFGLRNISINLRFIVEKVEVIQGYFSRKKDTHWVRNQKQSLNLEAFITRKKTIDFADFRENLSFKSNYFRFAFRFAVIMAVGYLISKSLNSSHSYWVLLSILVILKPGFSQTKQRNMHRIIGTFLGGLLGLSILYFIHNPLLLFFVLLFCMVMSFSFMRKDYVIYVLFMTAYLFAAYSFLGIGTPALVQERILDTFIGAAIAIVGAYIVLPNWEHHHANAYLHKCLLAINIYFIEVSYQYIGAQNFNNLNYKLARKRVNIEISNMASMVNNMFEEPKSKQVHLKDIQQINSLMHLFSSYTASLFLFKREHQIDVMESQDLKVIIHQIQKYIHCSAHIIQTHRFPNEDLQKVRLATYHKHDGLKAVRNLLLTMQNLSAEIYKLSKEIGEIKEA